MAVWFIYLNDMIRAVFQSIKAYADAFPMINKLGLWRYFAIPIAISILVAVGIGFAAYGLSDDLGAWISNIWPFEFGRETFELIAEIIGAVLIVALGLIVYKAVVMALSAPFMSPVSEKIEAHLRPGEHYYRNTDFNDQLWRGIRINARNLFRELVWTVPIFFLGLIPVIGIIAPILLFCVQAYYAGFGNMDYTLERQFGYKDSIRFVKEHRGTAIGNGLVFMTVLIIPVVGLILVLPLSVTAASLRTVEILEKEQFKLIEHEN